MNSLLGSDDDVERSHAACEHAPGVIPPDDVPRIASASATSLFATSTTGSSAHATAPSVPHICRVPGYVRRSTGTEHGNHDLCCGVCLLADGRFHSDACDTASYSSTTTPSSSSTLATSAETTDNKAPSDLAGLWQLSLDRRRARAGLAARQAVRVDWGETKRRLGTTGRNAKQELMPKADAGMGGCGAAASVQVKAPAGGMEACSDNDNTSRRIAQDHNVHGPAGTHG